MKTELPKIKITSESVRQLCLETSSMVRFYDSKIMDISETISHVPSGSTLFNKLLKDNELYEVELQRYKEMHEHLSAVYHMLIRLE